MRFSRKLISLLLSTVILGSTAVTAYAVDTLQDKTEDATEITEPLVETDTTVTTQATTSQLSAQEIATQEITVQETINLAEKPTSPYSDFIGTEKPLNESAEAVGSSNVIVGDVNFDGRIDVADVLLIQRHLCKIIVLTQDSLLAAITAESATASLSDVIAIQKYIASGRETQFPENESDRDVIAECYVTSLKLNTNNIFWAVGRSGYFKPQVSPSSATNQELLWSSSDESVATVNEEGKLTAVGVGTSTITCTSTDGSGKRDTCVVTIVNPVTDITLNTYSINWVVGKTGTYRPQVSPSDATIQELNWSSSDKKVAVVNEAGKLTAVGPGTCVITCAAKDGSGIKSTCKVVVKQPVEKLTLNKNAVTVKTDKTTKLTSKAAPANASDKGLVWTSSNKSIAKVSADGVVTGVKKGTVTITVTAKDGYGAKATCKVTVEESKSKGQQIADYAAQWAGVTPYVWGGTSLKTGADCSGFVCAVYSEFGYNLWNNRTTLSNEGVAVSLSNAQPGDIIVYYGHVGIYAGNGQVTHALSQKWGTLTTDISWGGTVKCVRRIV